MINYYTPQTPDEAKGGCLGYIIGIILGIIICSSLGSCRTPCNITELDNIHDTCFIAKYNHDSIYQRDSIVIREFIENDTFHVEHYKWMISYRDRISHDTIYISKTDTIIKTVMQKEKKKTLKDTLMDIMELVYIFIAAVVVVLAVFWWKGK